MSGLALSSRSTGSKVTVLTPGATTPVPATTLPPKSCCALTTDMVKRPTPRAPKCLQLGESSAGL